MVAKEVLNQCTSVKPDDTQATGVKGTTKEIVEYNFEYMSGFNRKWNTLVHVEKHPLSLMVSKSAVLK